MKKIKRWVLFGMVSALTLFAACTKDLNQYPLNTAYNQNYWQTDKDAKAALAGGYALLRTALFDKSTGNRYATSAFFEYGETPAGTMIGTDQTITAILNSGNFYGPYSEGYADWAPFYKAIAQANHILDRVPKMPEKAFASDPELKAKILGQAYFIRAFAYLYIVRIWGDVPIELKPFEFDGTLNFLARSPMDKVLEQCEADLLEAIKVLDFGYEDANDKAVVGNKGAAYACLADVYMWLKKPDKAVEAADKVIMEGGYSLTDYNDSKAVSDMFDGKSPEGIFEMNVDYAGSESFRADDGASVPNRTLMEPYIKGQTSKPWLTGATVLNTLYKDKAIDKRPSLFFYQFGSISLPVILTKYSNITYRDPGVFKEPYSDSNLSLFRLADMYLLKADAYMALKKPALAKEALDVIRVRAGLAPYSGTEGQLWPAIIAEEYCELVGEGKLWFNLIRSYINGNYDAFENISFSMDAKRKAQLGYFWPVSPNAFVNNNNMKQTEYWKTLVR